MPTERTDRDRDARTWPGVTGGGRERERGRNRAGLKPEVWAPTIFAQSQMPPLGTAWIYLPPRKIPLDLLGAQTGWAVKAGGGPSPRRRGPQRETVAAKSHPKLLAAQTCSWGGARRLRGLGVGVRGRLPPVSQPRQGRWLAWGPQNRSEGKRHSQQREQLVQRPGGE